MSTSVDQGHDPSPTFLEAKTQFLHGLSRDQRNKFQGCTLGSVQATIDQIQGKYASHRRLRNMGKVAAFLEAMNHIGRVVEVYLNASSFVCFIWGPIKFALLAAAAHVDALDALLDAYKQIGDLLPQLKPLENLYKTYPSVLKILETYVRHILNFHAAALEVFDRPAWKVIFDATWKTFNSKFDPIIHDLKVTRDLLSEQKLTSIMDEVQSVGRVSQDKLTRIFRQLKEKKQADEEVRKVQAEEMRRKRYNSIQTGLKVPDYRQDHDDACSRRQDSEPGTWILSDAKFEAWADMSSSDSKALYISGIPGAGKTVLASRVVEHLNGSGFSGKATSFAYFYFKHREKDATKSTLRSMLVSILDQLLRSDEASLQHVFQELTSSNELLDTSTSKIQDVLKVVLRSHFVCFLVLDGVDESTDCGAVVQFFQDLINATKTGDDGNSCAFRLLFCGQRDGKLDALLQSFPGIVELQLDDCSGHTTDIFRYVEEQSALIQKRFKLTKEERHRISEQTSREINGMFLYARVVLDNLLGQVSKAGLRRELNADIFPKKLDDAYRRVVVRVLEEAAFPQREAAAQILGWVCCVARPLFWREIQSMKCINVEEDTSDPEEMFVASAKEICGSLVDMVPSRHTTTPREEVVTLVHETAKYYLEENSALSITSEHLKMARFCAKYLTSKPFDVLLSEETRQYALIGYYGFVDYAASHWYSHFEFSAKVDDKGDATTSSFRNAAQEFLAKYNAKRLEGKKEDMADGVREEILALPGDDIQRGSVIDLLSNLREPRDAVQQLLKEKLDPEEASTVRTFYGAMGHKCPKPWCARFHTGFDCETDLASHVLQHERPFQCPHDDCFANYISFDTYSLLSKHTRRFHGPLQSLFPDAECVADLWKAASAGDLPTVKDLVAQGADVNSRKKKGHLTPLLLAVRSGHYHVCNFLLEHGANMKTRRRRADTDPGPNIPLLTAIANNDVDIVRLLCKHVKDPSILSQGLRELRDVHGLENSLTAKLFWQGVYQEWSFGSLNPFNLAAALGFTSILRELHATWPNFSPLSAPRERDSVSRTPLHYACAIRGDVSTVEYLLAKSDATDTMKRDEFGRIPLSYAVTQDNPSLDVIQRLIKANQDSLNTLDNKGRPLLCYAAIRGGPVLPFLISLRPEFVLRADQDGLYPLAYAVDAENIFSVNILLEQMRIRDICTSEVPVSTRGGTLWRRAVRNSRSLPTALHLVETGKVSRSDKGALAALAEVMCDGHARHIIDDRYKIFKLLLAQPGPISVGDRDKYGRTVLFAAISTWEPTSVSQVLQRADSDPFIKDNYGWTPLHWAMFAYFPDGPHKDRERDVIDLLLEFPDADVNAISSPTAAQGYIYEKKIPCSITPLDLLFGCHENLNSEERARRALAILRCPKFDATRYNTSQFEFLRQHKLTQAFGSRECVEIIHLLFSRGLRPPLENAIKDFRIAKTLLETHEVDVNAEIDTLSPEKLVAILRDSNMETLKLLKGTTVSRRLPDILLAEGGVQVVTQGLGAGEDGWLSASRVKEFDEWLGSKEGQRIEEVRCTWSYISALNQIEAIFR